MILFVDDTPDILQLYGALAHGLKHRKESCPKEALSHLQSNPARVIVTDYQMPGMSGKQFIAAARNYCPNARYIMVTGTPPDHFADNERPDEVITKPFDVLALRSKLKDLVSH